MPATNLPLNLIESILVPHDGFADALRSIEQVFDVSESVTESIGKPLIAESRTGKSRVIKEFVKRHPRSRSRDGLVVPVLSVKTPSKPTVKGLVELLLSRIGDPRAHIGTENQKTDRLMTLLAAARTRVMVIDEFHHFVDKSSMKVQHYLSDWLKVFLDDSGVAAVVVGLESSMAVLQQNEQLRGRFLAPARLTRFDWNNSCQRSEFVAVLSSFETVLSEYIDTPEIANSNMGFRIYVATGGLIGYLTMFLNQLVWNAVAADANALTLEDFHRAFEGSIATDSDANVVARNPFVRSFNAEPTAASLASALQVGLPAPEISATTRRRKACKHPTVGSALTAT